MASTPNSSPAPRPSAPRGGAFFVALGIFLSRISGLVRDRIFAHYLGNSDAAGAFRAALRIPNFLQNLFGEGVLSASFIPVYARLRAEGKHEEAGRVAGVIGALLSLLVSVLVAAGVGMSSVFVDLVAPGFEGELRRLVIDLVRILFPGVGLLVWSAWCLGILNSHRQFFISYAAPVLWNAAIIGALLIYGSRQPQFELVETLAWASVVGSFLQFAVQIPFVLRHARDLKFGFNTSMPSVRRIFSGFGPVVLSRGVVQLSAYIDSMIASFLGAGAVASLAYAQTLYLLPVSLFGMAVAAAELPEMSASSAGDTHGHSKLNSRVRAGRRQIAFFVIPSVLVFLFLGYQVVAALYQTGAFGHEDTLYVWLLLMGSAVSLLPATWGRLLSSAFYALGDTKTPMRLAFLRLAVSVALGWALAFPLRPYWIEALTQVPGFRLPGIPGIDLGIGAMALTFSSGFAGWVEYFLLNRLLRKRIGEVAAPREFTGKVWTSAALATAIAFGISFQVPQSLRLAGYNFSPLLVLSVFGITYLVLTRAMKVEESSKVLRRFGL